MVAPAGQMVVRVPQHRGSDCPSMHRSHALVMPGRQRHTPWMHASSARHVRSHDPQLVGSFAVSTQRLAHLVCPFGHRQ
jgi:hypothetical protein